MATIINIIAECETCWRMWYTPCCKIDDGVAAQHVMDSDYVCFGWKRNTVIPQFVYSIEFEAVTCMRKSHSNSIQGSAWTATKHPSACAIPAPMLTAMIGSPACRRISTRR
mmetsp:Transcript_52117/g.122388  ORF Transcript_52117/g.122388 Transcript_52117/m.122388 type:complete len:111 (+) Transcript_52117:687-1019(+)